MKLTPPERTRILEGSYGPLHRTDKPDIELRAEIVVSWTRPRAFTDDELKHVFRPSPEPAMWLVVTDIVRRTKGGWAVYFDVVDRRQPAWYLSKQGYTRAKRQAVDTLEAPVDPKTRARLTVEARQANVDRRLKDQEAREHEERKQQKVFRDRVGFQLRGLSPQAQVEFMAAVERLMAAQVTDEAA